ncbi:RING-H2 finger protein ATL72 [Smittium culicis]|uniref:RING-H2 finger protein ATL72 n=1 Tax=Smittium culicis TaxID=133412 RepID=A0A1R1XMD2_9FUNG|nr:RING-H2 finger protein ATL72 [Smittium culicis]
MFFIKYPHFSLCFPVAIYAIPIFPTLQYLLPNSQNYNPRNLNFYNNQQNFTISKRQSNSQADVSYTPYIFGFLLTILVFTLIRIYFHYRRSNMVMRDISPNQQGLYVRPNPTMRGNNVYPLSDNRVVYFSVFRPNLIGSSYVYFNAAETDPRISRRINPAADKKVFLTKDELDNNYPALNFSTINSFSNKPLSYPLSEAQPSQNAAATDAHNHSGSSEAVVPFHSPHANSSSDLKSNETECLICFESINNNDNVRSIPCNHFFHKDCLDVWLKTRSTFCPTCRYDLKIQKPNTNTD